MINHPKNCNRNIIQLPP